jgi:hypothetical protein
MKSYSMALVASYIPKTPNDIMSSTGMTAYGLWREINRRSHITPYFQPTASPLVIPEVDFVLAHELFGEPFESLMLAIKERCRYKRMLFLELSLLADKCDYNFVWLPTSRSNCELVPCPYMRDIIEAHNAPKIPGSVLLDHLWPSTIGTDRDWTPRLYSWLYGREHVAQLLRPGADENHVYPPWIKQIPLCGYEEYLEATAPYETFILTHPESYECSIIDMRARGTRVLVPSHNNEIQMLNPFHVFRLGCQLYETKEHVDLHLSSLLPPTPPPDMFTDMPDAFDQIDAYCQKVLTC